MKKILLICIILGLLLGCSKLSFASDRANNYTPYKCDNFKIGDIVTHSWRFIYRDDYPKFFGRIIKIEPKPTTEYIHWITVQKIQGAEKYKDIEIYSEQYLEK